MKFYRLELIFNLLFWLATAVLIISSFSIQGQQLEIINDVEYTKTFRSQSLIIKLSLTILISMILFYTNLHFLLKINDAIKRKRILLMSFTLFLIGLFSILIIGKINLGAELLPLPKGVGIGILIFYFTVSMAYGIGKVWIGSIRTNDRLILEKKKAELTLLRNQLQPHFLFNALNNLLSMVNQQQSVKLVESFSKLSDLLRYVIEETKKDKVSVNKEINFIKDYISLQLLRFEENEINVVFNIKGNGVDQMIEPGLFIPFIENAFKFGTEPESISNIFIEFDLLNGNFIEFTVKNSKLSHNKQIESTKTGISQVQNRLNLVYPGKHVLSILNKDKFCVNLKINTK